MKSTVKRALVMIILAGFVFASYSAMKIQSGNSAIVKIEKNSGVNNK